MMETIKLAPFSSEGASVGLIEEQGSKKGKEGKKQKGTVEFDVYFDDEPKDKKFIDKVAAIRRRLEKLRSGDDEDVEGLLESLEEMEEKALQIRSAALRENITEDVIKIFEGQGLLLKEKIGSGGHGAVYRTEHLLTGREVATKVLLFHDWEMRDNFEREGDILAELDHPNLVDVYTVDESEDYGVMTMEMIEGKNLYEHIFEMTRYTLLDEIEISVKATRGLVALHDAGIIHRDIKPENIFLMDHADEQDGDVRIGDVGIATFIDSTGKGLPNEEDEDVTGSLKHLSPERIMGESEVGSDVYALGVTFYELFTRGRLPMKSIGAQEVIKDILNSNLTDIREYNPNLPTNLRALVMRMLEKKPENRPDARRVLSILNDLLTEETNRFYKEEFGHDYAKTEDYRQSFGARIATDRKSQKMRQEYAASLKPSNDG
jgi:serine/threonine protein kinase